MGECTLDRLSDCVCNNITLQAKASACIQTSCEFQDQIITAQASRELCRGYPVDEHRRQSCRLLFSTLPVFTVAIVVLRFIARRMAKIKLWWDDWTALMALVMLFHK
ncbi:CFEM domain containing integral membrane protein [Colletotrichum truncatum]|uniref:CFEM domain containing integral membrane protein n=1 Tax=Colletotrichum truncatum TaxID=5467 RepID=A0ACC3Z396_COLTU|nr:CFEM domain containing integral membrane protein [Colletotrichum truncatum]KAF6793129.1 CFEM domain containing integral membrane protein [Colletotrichum truncatum]